MPASEPAEIRTDRQMRTLFVCAYAWRGEDDFEHGESDLSGLRARQGAEFDTWLADVRRRVIRAAQKALAGQADGTAIALPEAMRALDALLDQPVGTLTR